MYSEGCNNEKKNQKIFKVKSSGFLKTLSSKCTLKFAKMKNIKKKLEMKLNVSLKTILNLF